MHVYCRDEKEAKKEKKEKKEKDEKKEKEEKGEKKEKEKKEKEKDKDKEKDEKVCSYIFALPNSSVVRGDIGRRVCGVRICRPVRHKVLGGRQGTGKGKGGPGVARHTRDTGNSIYHVNTCKTTERYTTKTKNGFKNLIIGG